MKYIEKGIEPRELTEYKKTPGVSYDDINGNVKRAIRKALIEDQGYLCAYCGKRITLEDEDDLVIEHILPRSKFSSAQLVYENMLLSCNGREAYLHTSNNGKNRTTVSEHCDEKKKDRIIALSPLHHFCEQCFIYDDDGRVKPKSYQHDEGIQEIIDLLGLNDPVLVNKRRSALAAYSPKDYPIEQLEKDLIRLQEKDTAGRYEEFCFAVISYLQSTIL